MNQAGKQSQQAKAANCNWIFGPIYFWQIANGTAKENKQKKNLSAGFRNSRKKSFFFNQFQRELPKEKGREKEMGRKTCFRFLFATFEEASENYLFVSVCAWLFLCVCTAA